jgi:hypothetical protein
VILHKLQYLGDVSLALPALAASGRLMPSTAKANTTDNTFMVGFMSGLLQKLTLETDFERHQRETDSGVAQ